MHAAEAVGLLFLEARNNRLRTYYLKSVLTFWKTASRGEEWSCEIGEDESSERHQSTRVKVGGVEGKKKGRMYNDHRRIA